MNARSNLELLVQIAEELRPILKEVVFVGGCATELLLTDRGGSPVRITTDVDIIVEVASRAVYYRFSKRLRRMGFSEDRSEEAPICRWLKQGLKLDVMPTDESVLGFSNRWFEPAFRNASRVALGELELRVVSPPYFIATKLEAFRGRGKNDFLRSADLEDIVTLIDGRPSVVGEIAKSSEELRNYIAREIGLLMEDSDFVEALPGHLPSDSASQARLRTIIVRLDSLRA